MIRYWATNEYESVCQLFNTCFPDDTKFNAWFFKNQLEINDVLVCIKNNEIAGMLIRIPHYIKNIGKVTYIYGACTNPNYRRLGIMSKLIDFSHNEDIRLSFVASTLIPANKWLFDFYSQFGYQVSSKLDTITYTKNTIDGNRHYSIEPLTNKDIACVNEIYSNVYPRYVVRDSNYWDIQISMFASLSGQALVIKKDSLIVGYAFVWLDGDRSFIQEIGCINSLTETNAINLILATFKFNKIKAICLNNKAVNPFAMIKPHIEIKNTDFYSNLLLN